MEGHPIMPNAIVLMTALVPTVGHKYLIDFAESLIPWTGQVHVIVGSLSQEPVPGRQRVEALRDTYRGNRGVVTHWLDRDVPQDPSEHPDFWNVWRDIVREFVDVKSDDYFVASELYGINMANVLGCKFMPCNRYRETIPIKGTTVRNDIRGNFEMILPEFRRYLKKTVTVFGAESCGKTTMTKYLAQEMNGYFVPEWAREYLETVGPEVTVDKMRSIVHGQFAVQRTAQLHLNNKPWVFRDTDLYSTLGYYRLWGEGTVEEIGELTDLAYDTKSDMYIVMNDQIPFEADPLRYGGDKRESGMQYWIDLLEEFNLPYYVVKSTSRLDQQIEVVKFLDMWYNEQTSHIREFVR